MVREWFFKNNIFYSIATATMWKNVFMHKKTILIDFPSNKNGFFLNKRPAAISAQLVYNKFAFI